MYHIFILKHRENNANFYYFLCTQLEKYHALTPVARGKSICNTLTQHLTSDPIRSRLAWVDFQIMHWVLYYPYMTNIDILASWHARPCVLATMHHKERIIAPLFETELGIHVTVPNNFNSDAFGTFSGETARTGNQLEAARSKARAAMKLANTDLALASEGSFGAHPTIPFLASNLEIVVLIDAKHDLEIIGHYRTSQVTARSRVVHTADEAVATARTWGFPAQGVIMRTATLAGKKVHKDFNSESEIYETSQLLLSRWRTSAITLETDMRAHRCPSRLSSIEQATINLIHNCKSTCPNCNTPGFTVTDTTPGAPCGACRRPTDRIRDLIHTCQKCAHTEIRPATHDTYTDPGECAWCNP